ncbi:MAG: carotenoid biosynthesis protein [Nitrospiraceae bacterium]|nr:MAG: carotenoid biosynthesis protein [Nitrospiraceae bacterium]
MHLGIKRAFLFCTAGYFIAWLSEYSSIHNGFPYGYYNYIEHTKDQELWVLGVPFMDSLSYVFLAYASYSVALMINSPVMRSGRLLYILQTKGIRGSFHTRVLATVLFVYLDIIIDPVSLQGDKWFLGQIYEYPEKGVYFGVPISNFAGWFVVGYVLIYVLQKIDRYMSNKGTKDYFAQRYPGGVLIGPLLYVSVIIFMLSVTFYIRDYDLGWVGIFIFLLPALFMYSLIKAKLMHGDIDRAVKAHRKDFPSAVIPKP